MVARRTQEKMTAWAAGEWQEALSYPTTVLQPWGCMAANISEKTGGIAKNILSKKRWLKICASGGLSDCFSRGCRAQKITKAFVKSGSGLV